MPDLLPVYNFFSAYGVMIAPKQYLAARNRERVQFAPCRIVAEKGRSECKGLKTSKKNWSQSFCI
jgi:hypothetical protein